MLRMVPPVVFVELTAQLQFQRVHLADELLVHLLDQAGIARETAGIQIAHLIDQGLQFAPRLRDCPGRRREPD